MSGLPKSSRLKLAIVSDTIYPWTKGGAEIRYYEIYRRLAQKHNVHWFTMKYRGMRNETFNFEGIEVHCVCTGPDNLYRNGRRRLFPALFYTLGILLQMRKYRFDVIDVNETPFIPLFVIWLLRLIHSRTTIVSVWHEHWSLQYWQRYLGLLMGIGGYIIQHATSHIPDVLIPVSNTTKRLVANYTGRKEKDMELVENAVDCMIIRALREQVAPKRTRIITVSRLIPEKRVDKFIALVEKLHRIQPDIDAVVVGDGPERFQLEALATGLPIKFLGFLKDHEAVLK
ncbi:MAG: glycosyltransferase family 4 protein, partial [Candidatus Thorarchaeota archaeon]